MDKNTRLWTLVTDPTHVLNRARGYLDALSASDLSARKSSSRDAYAASYASAVARRISAAQHDLLSRGIDAASSLLKAYARISALPWKVAVLTDDVEDGYPHTHGDLIMLPGKHIDGSEKLVEILVHEMVHVYQRAHPAETHILILKRWQMAILDSGRGEGKAGLRANPDLNSMEYGSTITCSQRYTRADPGRLSDSRITCTPVGHVHTRVSDKWIEAYEHPYEAMAYIVTRLILNGARDAWQLRAAWQWMREYL